LQHRGAQARRVPIVCTAGIVYLLRRGLDLLPLMTNAVRRALALTIREISRLVLG
jgi:hypothetical protein